MIKTTDAQSAHINRLADRLEAVRGTLQEAIDLANRASYERLPSNLHRARKAIRAAARMLVEVHAGLDPARVHSVPSPQVTVGHKGVSGAREKRPAPHRGW